VVNSKIPVGDKRYDKLASMGKVSKDIISKLYSPIDAMNRFMNLALQNTDEDSQSRQFLLETKLGLRRMSLLLQKLDMYTRRIEEELNEISRQRK
jgi:cob(I)alamin adenosyltransferase